jgi:hypothetical protein
MTMRFHSFYEHKRSAGTSVRYMYHCAQNGLRQHAAAKTAQKGKGRDKGSMDAFQCKGWLHITLSDLSDVAYMKLDHIDDHVPYCSTVQLNMMMMVSSASEEVA